MIDEKLRQLIEEVPDYDRFMTVDEMTASSHQLAKTYPGVVEIVPLGHSRNGYPIEALKIGTGSRTGMMVGLPHPNEPIGAMMLETFSKKLAEDADFRAELDTTWYLIKCIDPDGTKLNEGWFSGPFTITNYARHFYRPPGEEQVEWTFPVDYKTYSFNQPLPETQAWMKLIEDCSPDFLYSLHNSGFGGVYLYLSHDIPPLYPPFYDLVNTVELPLHLGEPEAPFVPQFDQAVFGMMGLAAQYDYFSEHSKTDPAEIFKSG
ncbi:MAG: M14 family zinc carboxypeptidase, partial [Chloroflexota bacterium]